MSVITKNRCPACEAELVGNICKKCGYVLLIFPEAVPDSVAEMEKERIAVTKKRLADEAGYQRKMSEDISDCQIRINELTNALRKSEEREKSLKYHNDTLSGQVAAQTKEIQRIKSENSNALSENKEEINKHRLQIAELEKRIASKTIETDNLNSEIANLKEQLQQSASVPQSPLCGVVMVEDVRNDVRTALPIYDGTNTYGSNPDNGMHHQIRLLVRGVSFRPVHFTVRTSPKGLVFEAAAGATITQNGLIAASAVYARMSDKFMIENRIRISVSQI